MCYGWCYLEYLFYYFSLFVIYSFFGWIMEVILTFIKEKKFINRGFLIGPLIPIWGFGAILISMILSESDSYISLFFSSVVLASILEYFVNYLMEAIFKARWWDYSHLPFNLNGRIWFGSSAFFGIGGLLIINFSNPFLLNLFSKFNFNIIMIVNIIIFVLIIIDLCISCNIIKKLKLSAYSLKKDYTEEISSKVMGILSKKSKQFKRLLNAFPDIKFNFRKKTK